MPHIPRLRSHRSVGHAGSHPALLLAVLATLVCGWSLTAPEGATAKSGRISSTATTGSSGDTTTKAAGFLRRRITGLEVAASTATRVSLRWRVAPNGTGVVGYTLTRNGKIVARPVARSADVPGMQCGQTATVGVWARGLSGALTAPAYLTVATSPCADNVAPSAPTNLGMDGRTGSVLALSWSAATDNIGVVSYEVFAGRNVAATTPETAVSIADLVCGLTYTIGVRAVDGAGNRSVLAVLSASTADCPDTQAPSTPSLAGVLSGGRAQLSWQPSSDNVGVSSYALYQGGSPLAETTALEYVTGVLPCGQAFTFAIEARDAAGNRSGRGSAVVQTAACPAPPSPAPPSPAPPSPTPASPAADTSSPSAPSSPHVTSSTRTSLAVAWSGSSDNVGVTQYGVYRNGALDHETTALTSSLTGLTCGTTYTVGIDATDAAGNRSPKSEFSTSTLPCADSQAPTKPSNLHTTSVTQTSAAIAWNVSTDNVGVVGYGVYWSGPNVANPTEPSFVLTGLTCGTGTTVEIDAVDGSSNRSAKASLYITTAACPDSQAPTAPTGLQTTSVGQTSLTLGWSASGDNVGVSGYDLYVNSSKVGTASTTSYAFSGLTCGTSSTLGVVAFDGAGNRSAQATLAATTSACPPPPAGGSGGGSLYLSTSGSDSNACTQAAPCLTFDRAYHKANPGDVVYVGSGDYGGQSLSYNAALVSASSPVVFTPAAGGTPSLSGELSLRASASQPIANVEFQNMTVGSIYVKYVKRVTFRNIANTFFFVRSSDTVSFIGGSSGGDHNGNSDTIGSSGSGEPQSTNILIDGVAFHDFNNDLAPGTHQECIFIQDASNVTIRNSSFSRCRDFDIYANVLFGTTISNILIEGNQFGVTWPVGYYAFRANVGSFVFRNNTWDQGMSNDAPVVASGCGNTVSSSGFSMPAALLKPC